MITSAVLLLACPLSQAPVTLPTTEPVLVEITQGYGTLLAGGTTAALSGVDGEQWVEGRGHLSLMATGEATLRWHGRASLGISGPCDIDWEACDASGELQWSFQRVTTAMIETRRAPLSIALGKNWSVSIPPGALTLRGIANGDYEVLQHAGTPASYHWEGPREHTRPAQQGVIGRPVRLGAQPSSSRRDHSAHLDGRPEWAWPWREEAQDVPSWGYRDWPWVAGPPQPVTVRIDRTPAPPEVLTPPTEIEVSIAPTPLITEPAAAPAPAPVVTEDIAPGTGEIVEDPQGTPDGDGTWGWESDESKTAGPWRGLNEEGFSISGDYRIQNGIGILFEELADGGVRFWIPEDYTAGGWVLGPRLDTRLAPGGSIEFGPTGALRQHSGGVRVLAALER